MNQIFILTSILIFINVILWLYFNGKENVVELGKFQFQQQQLNTINDI